jgi:hypothetical protein
MALKDWLEHEEQWFSTSSFRRLLNHMRVKHDIGQTKLGRRKLRLFACGVCRLMVFDQPVPQKYRDMVEAAEKFADDKTTKAILEKLKIDWTELPGPEWGSLWHASDAMNRTVTPSSASAASGAASCVLTVLNLAKVRGAKKRLCRAVYEIFGNPYRAPGVDRSMLLWRDATLTKLAQTIYEERRFGDLPILADALEEAGCTDADVLSHCREPGEHVRGCWVVDLMLGKDFRKGLASV